jgi:hypothetical protein
VLADRWAQCEEDHLALSQREVQSLRVLADRWAHCEEDHLALSQRAGAPSLGRVLAQREVHR